MTFRLTLISLGTILCLISSCIPPLESSGPPRYLNDLGDARGGVNSAQEGFWDGDDATGPAKIRLNLTEQKAYFYKGDQLVGFSPISSGDELNFTPKGNFKVTQKSPDHRSSLYGEHIDIATGAVINPDVDTRKDKVPTGAKYVGAPMFNFLRFNRSIGMHEGYLPGYSASHGCIRLPKEMAKHFFDAASIGTPVIVE